jgi:hypothetical protein
MTEYMIGFVEHLNCVNDFLASQQSLPNLLSRAKHHAQLWNDLDLGSTLTLIGATHAPSGW